MSFIKMIFFRLKYDKIGWKVSRYCPFKSIQIFFYSYILDSCGELTTASSICKRFQHQVVALFSVTLWRSSSSWPAAWWGFYGASSISLLLKRSMLKVMSDTMVYMPKVQSTSTRETHSSILATRSVTVQNLSSSKNTSSAQSSSSSCS